MCLKGRPQHLGRRTILSERVRSDDSVGVVVVLDGTFTTVLNKLFPTALGGCKCGANSLEKYLVLFVSYSKVIIIKLHEYQ